MRWNGRWCRRLQDVACVLLLAVVLAGGMGGGPTLSTLPRAAAQTGNLQDEKTQAEVSKLKEEVRQLQSRNDSDASLFGKVATFAGLIGGAVGSVLTIVIGVLGYVIPNKLNQARLQSMHQEKELARERHNLDLFRGLASPTTRLQLAAAAALLQRIFNQPNPADGKFAEYEAIERKTIVDVLVSVLKERPKLNGSSSPPRSASPELMKYIADNIVKALAAVQADGKPVAEMSPLAVSDWQRAQLPSAWWKGVDARGIDFFEANLEGAGLADAHLNRATFYSARLCKAVLRNADLTNANLQGADLTGANLIGADLTGALLTDAKLDGIRFDATTRWPAGFQLPRPAAPQATA